MKMKPTLQRAFLGMGIGLVGVVALLALPTGRLFDRWLTKHFIRVNERREQHRMSWLDGVECHVLYTGIASAGRLVSPEAGSIIWHYLYGNGTDLWLDPEYISTSPVVRRSVAQLGEGESRQFAFRQAKDWRLSYAVNPFSLRKNAGRVLLWQYMKFDTRAGTRTTLNYGLGQFELPDALIYSMHPQAYTVYSQWKI